MVGWYVVYTSVVFDLVLFINPEGFGLQAIQEELLPPPVHMYTAKNAKSSSNNEASIVGTEN